MLTKKFVPALVASLAAAATSVKAAVPEAAQAVFTGAQADAVTVQGLGFTLMATVVGGFIVFKLVKKAANKAT